jgi:hypothetical protein
MPIPEREEIARCAALVLGMICPIVFCPSLFVTRWGTRAADSAAIRLWDAASQRSRASRDAATWVRIESHKLHFLRFLP